MAADLEFRIGAELTEIKGALAGLQRDLQNVGNTARTAGGNDAFRGLQQSAQGALGTLGRLAAGFVTVAGAIRAIGAADALNTLNARLQLVTRSTEEFQRAQQALFDLSQRTRSDLGETIGLYTQIANATRDAGVGQEVLLEVVETINQAVQLSGTSAQAAQAALVQLGQGLASGTLRGEELNSILEQTPALAQAIADGLGITRGELRRYGEEGRITAQAVIEALQRQRDVVAGQFAQLPLTVGQAVTQLRNAGTRLLGVFNDASGATSGLAQVIADFAAFIQSDQVIGAVIEFANTWSQAFADITQDASDAIAIIRGATTDLVGDGRDAVSILSDAFLQLPRNLRTVARIVTTVFAGVVDSLVADATLAKEAFQAIFTDDTIEAAIARRNARVNNALQTVRELVAEEVQANRDAVAASQRLSAEAEARRRRSGQANPNNRNPGNFRQTQSNAQAQAAAALRKAELDAQEKLAEDSARRQLQILEQQFDDGLLAATNYYTRRQEIELAGIDRAIALEQQRAQAGGAERVKALAEIELLERRKTDVIQQAERDRAEFRRNLERQLADARIQELQAQGNTAEAARLQAEARFADLRRTLVAEGDAAGVALIDRLINTQAADARLQELTRQVSDAVSNLRGQESLIAAQVEAGQLPALAGEQQLQDARAAGIAQLQQYLAALRAIADAQTQNGGIADPRVVEAIRNTETEIARATAAQRTFQNQAQQAGQSALQGFFTDIATGARSFGDAIQAAALAFIQSLARMAAEALAKRAILSLTGPGGFLAGIFHSGGIVGQGAPSRMVNPLLFAAAPRYHSGGMVGLKPDERPAILQTGEEVLSRSDPRNAANGGGGGGGGVRILNVIDPAMVSDYLASSAGEKTILNVLQRNPGAVRQVLA